MTVRNNVSPSTPEEHLVVDFFHAMGPTFEAFERNFVDRLAEDAEWESVGLPVRRGRAACLDYLHDLNVRTGMEYCTIDFISLATSQNTVLSERVDTMLRADGSPIMRVRIMGAVEVRNGKIIRYTDYFDMASARSHGSE